MKALSNLLAVMIIFTHVNSVIVPIPAVTGCEISTPDNAITKMEVTATCFLEYLYNETMVADESGSCTSDDFSDSLMISVDVDGKVYDTPVSWFDGTLLTSISSDGFEFGKTGSVHVAVYVNETKYYEGEVRVIPGWTTLVPAIVMFIVAITTRQVLVALPMGVWMGAWLMEKGLNPLRAFFRVWDVYFVEALGDIDHAYVMSFTLFLAGIVGIINRSGGTQGIADALATSISSSTSAMWTVFVQGLAIFFDDYADALICGNTMRVFMDATRISREKFSFLVDATAAPIASVAPISSWIGFEVGLIEDNYINVYGEETGDTDAYTTFIRTLPYRFYPWLMLIFMLVSLASRRDFGPMVRAERRARATGKVVRDGARVDEALLEGDPNMMPKPEVVQRGDFYWYLAEIPILTVIFGTLIGMITTGVYACRADGIDESVKNIFSNGDSWSGLLWACVLGTLVAMGLAVWKKTLTFEECMNAWLYGMKTMVEPLLILLFAWSIGAVIRDLHAPDYLVAAIGDSISEKGLPALCFVLAALISLCIGTSWGTMSIMFPLVVPIAVEVGNGDVAVITHSMGTILAGSVFGDHCSPISDTTILSSIACGCDHDDHVRTQIVYAVVVGVISVIFGDLLSAAGVPNIVCIIIGALLIIGIIFALGVKIPTYTPDPDDETKGELEADVSLDLRSPFENFIGKTLWSVPFEFGKGEIELGGANEGEAEPADDDTRKRTVSI